MRRAGLSRRTLLTGGLALAGGAVLTGFDGDFAEAVTPPQIVGCAGWGARAPKAAVPVLGRRPVRIVVHHTASPNVADFSRSAADRLARSIQRYHMDVNRWIDSGQHFTISRGGVILEGRHRSLEALRAGQRHVEGAHAAGQNGVAIGIENEGIYTGAEPPAVLWGKLRALCAYACARYRIRPSELYGHRDYNDTACPGNRLYAMLPRLRREVGAALGMRQVADPLTWPLLRVADRGDKVRAAQHLLRQAGVTEVAVNGEFGRDMADGVRRFQRDNGLDETGMIGGATWPLIATPVRSTDRGEAAHAAELLARHRPLRTPSRVSHLQWQLLLSS